MKKLIFFTIALLFVFSSFQISHAKRYYRTYEVAEITDQGMVLQDFEGRKFLIEKDPNGIKAGDLVRYDSVRNRLNKSAWQPAEITKMTDRTISLKLKNGDKVDVNMRSSYHNEFEKGDQVHYSAANSQIKKSNLQKMDEE